MTLTYSLDENDYLNMMLFSFSKEEQIIKKRRNLRQRVTFLFFIAGLMLLYSKNKYYSYYSFGLAVLSFFFYQNYSAWLYKRNCKKIVFSTYKNKIGKTNILIIDKEKIRDCNESKELKVLNTQLEKIYETKDYFFIKLKSPGYISIPKLKIENTNLVKDELKTIATSNNVDFVEMIDWKWK